MAASATRSPSDRLRQAVDMSQRGDLAGAEAVCGELLARAPGDVEANHFCGVLANRMRRYEVAAERLARCVRADARRARAHAALGFARERLGRLAEARDAYAAAVRAEPAFAEAHVGLGAVCMQLGRLEDAKAAFSQAVRLRPDLERPRLHLAELHMANGDSASAREALEGHGAPSLPESRALLATILLGTGELERGWREYAFRPTRGTEIFDAISQGSYPPALGPDLRGTRLALLGEQGLGDVLFFLRSAKPLADEGAKLVVRADRRLEGPVRRALPVEEWIEGDAIPAADAQPIWMGDLPHLAMRRTGGGAHETLHIPPLGERLERVRAKLEALPRPRFAIAWRAGTAPGEALAGQAVLSKDVPRAALGAALRGSRGSLISIQRRPGAGETDELASHLGAVVHDFSGANDDIEDMLALLASVEGYVGVSSTNVHLAAAVAAPARVLVPCPADWRWQERGPSPFFPHYPAYRQDRGGDWSAALARLRADLEAA